MWSYLTLYVQRSHQVETQLLLRRLLQRERRGWRRGRTIQCKKREKGVLLLVEASHHLYCPLTLSLCSLLHNRITTHSTPRSYIFTYPGFRHFDVPFPHWVTGWGWLIWVSTEWRVREWSCEAPDIRQIRRLRSDVVYKSTQLIRTRPTRMRPRARKSLGPG